MAKDAGSAMPANPLTTHSRRTLLRAAAVGTAAGLLTDGTSNDLAYLSTFPYLAHPQEGFEHSHD